MGRSFKDQSSIRKQPTEMRIKALIIIATISVQIFCQLHNKLSPSRRNNQRLCAATFDDSDSYFQAAIRAPKPARDNTGRVEDLLARMTLEEKIGQMTQLQIAMVTSGEDQNIHIDPAKLDKAVVKYGVGSILNVNSQALTVDKWREIIGQIQQAFAEDSLEDSGFSMASTRFTEQIMYRVPRFILKRLDGRYMDPALMQRLAEITAAETRGRRHSLDLLASA